MKEALRAMKVIALYSLGFPGRRHNLNSSKRVYFKLVEWLPYSQCLKETAEKKLQARTGVDVTDPSTRGGRSKATILLWNHLFVRCEDVSLPKHILIGLLKT